MKVYILHHIHPVGDEEDVKLIGVYSTEETARAAVHRLASLPGFVDSPRLQTGYEETVDGFQISAYDLDKDHWTEGFVTVV